MADAVRDHELLKELGESLENQILLLGITIQTRRKLQGSRLDEKIDRVKLPNNITVIPGSNFTTFLGYNNLFLPMNQHHIII